MLGTVDEADSDGAAEEEELSKSVIGCSDVALVCFGVSLAEAAGCVCCPPRFVVGRSSPAPASVFFFSH